MRTHLSIGKGTTRIAAAATLIAGLGFAGEAIAARDGGTPAVSPGYMAPGPTNTCFWRDPQINPGPIDQLHQHDNWAAPSTDTSYYYSRDQIPGGATLTLHGQYPHARFMDFTSYKTIGGVNGFPATSLVDDEIKPDRGSVNPFRPGARRDGRKRAFTITLSPQQQPANPEPNTLYGGQPGTGGQVEVIMRTYRPDRGYNGVGGVPLPTPTVTLANGSTVTGQAACNTLQTHSGSAAIEPLLTGSQGLKPAVYKSLRDSAPAPHPATNPVTWYRFFNPQRLLEPFLVGTPKAGLISSLPSTVTGGYYSTPNNAYVYGYVDRTIGPNRHGHNIVVLHAKMPTHPDTYDREAGSTRRAPRCGSGRSATTGRSPTRRCWTPTRRACSTSGSRPTRPATTRSWSACPRTGPRTRPTSAAWRG